LAMHAPPRKWRSVLSIEVHSKIFRTLHPIFDVMDNPDKARVPCVGDRRIHTYGVDVGEVGNQHADCVSASSRDPIIE
jgi:hypothetical protein